ncbi:sortase family protein [Kribbella voronezhensis]|uniref:Sortase family protein n=1 Tax=Kribbella voronezhensis TaxID=2512212 RepID=A0A4R7TCW8_9ACTN|nr:class F sortase [Kribbella voronezhensis]TDU89157.1 sortase family protein [Kribbella voronezhensis]
MALEGCAAQVDQAVPAPGEGGGVPAVEQSAPPSVLPGRVGTPAASQRVRFVPTEVVLPGGRRAPVLPASTVNGQLVVPEHVQRVGWWDGGAEAGDPFGSVVLAGHVDSATEGIGFFVRLRQVKPGEIVVLRGDGGHSASYRISTVTAVPKDALATTSGAFDQTGDHRLVLITCTGAYDPAKGGYAENLVVTAAAIGLAR